MIVCVLSLGSLWQEPKEENAVVWNSTAVEDMRGLQSGAAAYGQVRFRARLLQEALGTARLRGSLWQAGGIGEHSGIRKLNLERRAPRGSHPDWYAVRVTEELVGALDENSWQPEAITVVSFSTWRTRQECLLLARRHAWIRGAGGSAVLTPLSANGDWVVTRW